MFPTIDKFVSWANTQSDVCTTAAVSREGNRTEVGKLSQNVGALARFFNTESARNAKSEAVVKFGDALTERYGQYVTDKAIRSFRNVHGYDAYGKTLDAATIKEVVNYAKLIAKESMLTPEGINYRLSDGGNLQIENHVLQGMSEEDTNKLTAFRRILNGSERLLSECPVGSEVSGYQVRFKNVYESICRLEYDLRKEPNALAQNGESNIAETMTRELTRLKELLANKFSELDELAKNAPLANDGKENYRDVLVATVSKTVVDVMKKIPGHGKEKFDAGVQKIIGSLETTDNTKLLDKDFRDNLADEISKLAKSCGGSSWGCGAGKVKHILKKQLADTLNRGSWDVIDKTFTSYCNGKAVVLNSTITPAKHIPDAEFGYPPGVNGYMCHCMKETQHAVNLATSKLDVIDGNGERRTAFAGIRHAVNCAWRVGNNAARKEGNKKRAAECIKAAFITYFESLSEEGKRNVNRADTKFLMSSTSLLTPDKFRYFDKNEAKMLREQMQAWDDAIKDGGVSFDYKGEVFMLKPEIMKFNFGVNEGSVGGLGAALLGWYNSNKYNVDSMTQLAGKVAEFCNPANDNLRNDPEMEYKRQTVKTLFDQLSNLWRGNKEMDDDHDVYKAASRVAVITYLMGGVPAWNCKSGKDRTGELDVECKFLATLIERRHPIPEPGVLLTKEQSNLFRSIALQSGNLEMQQYNTGVGGFKLGGIKSIEERLGSATAKKFHAGGAHLVDA